MKSFCTTSDINFLYRGLALYDSLLKQNDDFKLYYLCSDDESYDKLLDLNKEKIIPISLSSLLEEDIALKEAMDNDPSYEAVNVGIKTKCNPKKVQFFWCLSAYFTWWVLDQEEVEDILYIDPDIYFYNDWQLIYDEIGDKSIGLVRHRIPYSPAVGEYNVGIVYFRKDLKGYACSDFWKNCLLDINNKYYKTHGMCGDQKYLELFSPLFGEQCVSIIDKKVGHLAPWNLVHHQWTDSKIIWEGIPQDVMYCHFSDFKPNFDNNTYDIAPRHGFAGEIRHKVPKLLNSLYDEYFEALKTSRKY